MEYKYLFYSLLFFSRALLVQYWPFALLAVMAVTLLFYFDAKLEGKNRFRATFGGAFLGMLLVALFLFVVSLGLIKSITG